MLIKYYKKDVNGKLCGGPMSIPMGEADGRAITLLPGYNDVDTSDWLKAKNLLGVKQFIELGYIEEIEAKVEQQVNKVEVPKMFEEFIADVKVSEVDGFFVVTLEESAYTVKVANKKEALKKAYALYLEAMKEGIKESISYFITAKDFNDLSVEKRDDVINNTFSLATLKKWEKGSKNEADRMKILRRIDEVKNYKATADKQLMV